MARMASTYLEVEADIAVDAHRRRDFAALATARERSMPVILRAEAVVRACGVSPKSGSRQQADLAIRTARAFRCRLEGRDDPATWKALAADWQELGDPYESGRARWREAEALLDQAHGRSTRTVAREPLVAAAEAAYKLGAWPLLRSVAELARRAMITAAKADRGHARGPAGVSGTGAQDGHSYVGRNSGRGDAGPDPRPPPHLVATRRSSPTSWLRPVSRRPTTSG